MGEPSAASWGPIGSGAGGGPPAGPPGGPAQRPAESSAATAGPSSMAGPHHGACSSTGGPQLPQGGLPGMAVIAAVIEVGSEAPIKGLDPLVSEVCGRPLERVPIVRIYGPWGPGGPHCCVHLHGLFPYFYVPVPPEAYGKRAPHFLRSFARHLVLQADRLMAAKMRSSREGGPRGLRSFGTSRAAAAAALKKDGRRDTGGAPKGGPLVYKIEVVRRLPFYGYHREAHAFLKLYLTQPNMVGPLAGLLLQGAVTGAPLQPYEVHLNFTVRPGYHWLRFVPLRSARIPVSLYIYIYIYIHNIYKLYYIFIMYVYLILNIYFCCMCHFLCPFKHISLSLLFFFFALFLLLFFRPRSLRIFIYGGWTRSS